MSKAEKIFRACYNETARIIDMCYDVDEKACWHTLWGFAEDKHAPNRTCNAVEKIVQSKLKAIDFDIRHGFADKELCLKEQKILNIIQNTVNNQRKLNAEL